MKNLHENHRQRLRRRYETAGLETFEDHVILELLLFEALPRVDTNPIAHRLLDRFGSLDGVFSASEEELCQVKGVGPAAASVIADSDRHMLFRILADCDFRDAGDEALFTLSLAASYHMRTLPHGSVFVLFRDFIYDYPPEMAEDPGFPAVLAADLSGSGCTEYAVIVSEGAPWPEDSGIGPAYRLAGEYLEKL